MWCPSWSAIHIQTDHPWTSNDSSILYRIVTQFQLQYTELWPMQSLQRSIQKVQWSLVPAQLTKIERVNS